MNNQRDSDGFLAPFTKGKRVYVVPNKMLATVKIQHLHWDGDESFWGNVDLIYDDGITGTSNNWQLIKVIGVCSSCNIPILEINKMGVDCNGIYISHLETCKEQS